MTTNNCGNCKHWSYDKKITGKWGWCNLTWSEESEPVHKQSIAVAQDTEGYHAHLETKEHFYCSQWEKKNE